MSTSILKSNPAKFKLSLPEQARSSVEMIRRLGVGVGSCEDSQICGILRSAVGCNLNKIPSIISTTWDIDGPLLDKDLQSTFGGPNIQVWGGGQEVPGVAAVSNSVPNQNGILQTGLIVRAIGFQITAEPICGTAEINWVTPSGPLPQISPPSLDVFTGADSATALGLLVGHTESPAFLDWGWPMQYAAFHFVQATTFDFIARNRYYVMSDPLRNIAHFGGNGGECGGDAAAGTSQVDVMAFLQRANAHYANLCGCGNIPTGVGIPINRRRQGLFGGTSVARGTRDYDLMSVSYGLDLQSKCGNPMYKMLPLPYYIPANSPIIAQLSVTDEVQHNLFLQNLSATDGFGGATPPVETADPRILAGLDSGFPELSLDAPAAAVVQTLPVGRIRVKGGTLLMSMNFLGWEISDDFCTAMSSQAMKAQLQAELGIQYC